MSITTTTTTTVTTTTVTTNKGDDMSERFYNDLNLHGRQAWYMIFKDEEALTPPYYDAVYDFNTADLILAFLHEAQPNEHFYIKQVELTDM